jgi:hypothetical protein
MVGSSKILTVSYGTFSCTLEGFDEPFSTMRSIAEYFRDLAADDRYFGAEPPTPDAEMLQRIAEKEIQRRVEARVQDNGLVLTQMDDVAETPAVAAPAAASVAAATAFAPAYEDEIEIAGEDLPQAADVPEIDVAEGTAETVAEKLSRIRAVVDSAREEETAAVDEDDSDVEDIAQDLSADVAEEDNGFDDDATEDDIADALSAFDAEMSGGDPVEPEIEAEAEIEDDEKEPEEITSTWDDQDEMEVEASDISAEAEEADSTSEEMSDDLTSQEADEPFVLHEAEEDGSDDAEPVAEAEAEDDAETVEDDSEALAIGRVVKLSGDDYDAGIAAEADSDEDDDDMDDETSFDLSDEVASEDTSSNDDWGFDEPEDDANLEDLATLDGADNVTASWDDNAEDVTEDDEDDLVSVDHEDVAGFDADEIADEEMEAPAAAEAADDADDDFEDDVDTESQDDFAASIRAALSAADSNDDDDTDHEISGDDDVDLEMDEHSDPLAAGALAASERLGSLSEAEEQTSDVDRLLEKTNSEMEESEGSRRRSAIAHLKAAVAATKADRLLNRISSREEVEEDEQTQYRDDLAQVVRPRRPEGGDASSERPQPFADTPSPLMLVSELRVDEEGNTMATDPIRPRRVSHDEAAEASADAESSSYEDGASFAEFAEKMGAKELPDLLEAAAAYAAFVENRPHFSRPQLMKRVARHDTSGEFTREAGLRSFGQLLRQGKIRKLKRGQFTVADTTRFNPDARIAGE